MNRPLIATFALIAGIAIASPAFGQRHDEKPHGYNAQAAASVKTEVVPAAPGRHDEKPHGVTRKVTPAKVAATPGATPSSEATGVKPDATKAAR